MTPALVNCFDVIWLAEPGHGGWSVHRQKKSLSEKSSSVQLKKSFRFIFNKVTVVCTVSPDTVSCLWLCPLLHSFSSKPLHVNNGGGNESHSDEGSMPWRDSGDVDRPRDSESREADVVDGTTSAADINYHHKGSADKQKFNTLGYQVCDGAFRVFFCCFFFWWSVIRHRLCEVPVLHKAVVLKRFCSRLRVDVV